MDAAPILEEFCQYRLYPDPADLQAARRVYQGEEGAFVARYLDALRALVLARLHPLWREYLWHDGALNLSAKAESAQPHLYGRVVVGDGLEDEWFIAFLLLELSKCISGLVITLSDADGEFLLIEAAEHLPDWLEPEVSDDRVFLHQGKVHIVGMADLPTPTLAKSLGLIRRDPFRTTASKSIQRAIEARIAQFRGGRQQEVHHARVTVPRVLASALQAQPGAISSIVNAVNYRNPSDLAKAASKSRLLLTDQGDLDLKSIRVSFTRPQFAHLLCQQIHPPRGYPMPPDNTPDYLAASLGLKLYIGAQLVLLHDKPDAAEPDVAVEAASISLLRGHFGIESVLSELSRLPLGRLLRSQAPVTEYFGLDGDLGWLDVEEGPIVNKIAEKMQGLQLTPEDSAQIVQKMLDEEEGMEAGNAPPMTSRLAEFLRASSGIKGIHDDGDEEEGEVEGESDSDSDGEGSFNDSTDDSADDSVDGSLVEREILEAVMHDPDLLMKILERGADLGLDSTDFLQRLKEAEQYVEKGKPSVRQKGIADIDPEKIQQARTRSRPQSQSDDDRDEEDDCNNEGDCNKEDEETHVAKDYDPSVPSSSSEDDLDNDPAYKDPARPPKDTEAASSEDSELSICEYMEAMDAELLGTACDREINMPSRDLQESLRADASPAHTVLLSIK